MFRLFDELRTWLALRKNPWLHSAFKAARRRFNASPKIMALPKAMRLTIGQTVLAELLAIATAADRLLAFREWFDRLVIEYSYASVLFVSASEATLEAAGDWYHPGVGGLRERIDDIIATEWFDELRKRNGTIERTREALWAQTLLWGAYLDVAYDIRHTLGDLPLSKDRDWFPRFIGCMCAVWERRYREAVGMPALCDLHPLFSESTLLEANILKGYKDPLEGVVRAERIVLAPHFEEASRVAHASSSCSIV
jgi:hypothetical protein